MNDVELKNPIWTCLPPSERLSYLMIFAKSLRGVHFFDRLLLWLRICANIWSSDGVAPRAKMNQQRSRRFRSAQEAKQKDEDKEELAKMLKSQKGNVVNEDAMTPQKTWDSNAITPGTPFMDTLAASLRYWCAYKVNTDPAWEKVGLDSQLYVQF